MAYLPMSPQACNPTIDRSDDSYSNQSSGVSPRNARSLIRRSEFSSGTYRQQGELQHQHCTYTEQARSTLVIYHFQAATIAFYQRLPHNPFVRETTALLTNYKYCSVFAMGHRSQNNSNAQGFKSVRSFSVSIELHLPRDLVVTRR